MITDINLSWDSDHISKNPFPRRTCEIGDMGQFKAD